MHHTQAHVLAVLGRVQQGARLRGTHAPGRGGQVARGASRIATVRLLQDILRRVADAQCSEISFLLGVKSKYIPGGEFEPDWKGPVGAPGMPPTGPPPDAGPPPPPPEVHAARPAWRTVSTRTSKKKKKDQMPAAAFSVTVSVVWEIWFQRWRRRGSSRKADIVWTEETGGRWRGRREG